MISFCYKDVTADDNDFTNGLAGVLYEKGKRGESDPGKIAMWAWAAQRAMDYAQTLDCLDSEMLTCYAVSGIYEKYRKKGFVYEDRLPQVNDMFHDGCIGYHMRAGLHYFSREDWLKIIKFVKKHSHI